MPTHDFKLSMYLHYLKLFNKTLYLDDTFHWRNEIGYLLKIFNLYQCKLALIKRCMSVYQMMLKIPPIRLNNNN